MAKIDCSQAANFIRESKRMCEYYRHDCDRCPMSIMNNGYGGLCAAFIEQHPETAVEIVQKWSDDEISKAGEELQYYDDVVALPKADIKTGGDKMRERLMKLLGEAIEPYLDRIYPWDTFSDIADYLLDNGVIVPPVKVGQTVWYIKGGYYNAAVKRACEKEVTEINIKCQNRRVEWGFVADGTRYKFSSIGKTVFLTREDAEAALKARENNVN